MRCPKCGRDVEDRAVICPTCEYILDTSFLGDDILNEPAGDLAAAADGFDDDEDSALRTVASPFGGDAVILGDLDEEYGETFTEATGAFLSAGNEEVSQVGGGPTPVYVGASAAALVLPDAVLGVLPEVELAELALTPFEQHVVSFIDGERTFAALANEAGLALDDLKIAVTMLAEKRAVGLIKREDVELTAAASSPALAIRGLGDPTAKVPSLASHPSVEAADDEEGEPVLDDPSPVPSIPGGAAPSRARAARAPAAKPKATAAASGKAARKKKLRIPPAARAKAKHVYEKALEDINHGRMARALQFARLAAKLDPTEPRYEELVANWGQAEEVALESESAPEDLRLFREAGAAERAGDHKKAVSLLRQAIAANDSNGQLHNRLGVILATRLKDFTGAMSALFRAVELEPNNQAFRNNLGKVLARAEGKKSADINIDELISGVGEFDRDKALRVGKRKNPWSAFGKKKW